jgi:release factor glutamine methyltransferase
MSSGAAISTIGEAAAFAAARLAATGIAEPRREARLLLALALGVDPAVILGYPERALAAGARRRLEDFVVRRSAGEPVSRLRGNREFWSLDFALSAETLDPRPDSETLIGAALEFLPDRAAPLRLLDLGTGTGCLLLALLSELPQAFGVGIDLAPGAVLTARRNAAALGLGERARFVAANWGEAISAGVDVILTNPPYIPSDSIAGLDLAYEPRAALDGGSDGLGAYRLLAPTVKRLLTPTGLALFEVGAGQAGAVARLLEKAGLVVCAIRRDLAGIERCLVATRQIKNLAA